MPRSAVFLALRISTVLFFYDGGGEVLCCRPVCHRSNEPTTDARLVFIVDEILGIDPAVELGGVAVPFHQSLRSSAHLAALHYRFHAVHFIGGYRRLLQLRFAHWYLVYHEDFFAPIRHVAFFEQSLELTDAHAIRHTEFGHALIVCDRIGAATPLLGSSHSPMTEPCRCYSGSIVVRLHKVLKDVYVSPRLVFREVSPHVRLQRKVESFDDARLRLRIVSGEVMDAVIFNSV